MIIMFSLSKKIYCFNLYIEVLRRLDIYKKTFFITNFNPTNSTLAVPQRIYYQFRKLQKYNLSID